MSVVRLVRLVLVEGESEVDLEVQFGPHNAVGDLVSALNAEGLSQGSSLFDRRGELAADTSLGLLDLNNGSKLWTSADAHVQDSNVHDPGYSTSQEPTLSTESRYPRKTEPEAISVRLPSVPQPPNAVSAIILTVPILAAAAILSIVTSSLAVLAFALTGPVAYAVAVASRRRDYRLALAKVSDHRERLVADAERRADINAAIARSVYPDCAQLDAALRPSSPAFRSPTSAEFLVLRVGTGLQPTGVIIEDPDLMRETPLYREAVVPIDLKIARRLNISGKRGDILGAARSILIQLAALHSPDDLHVSILGAIAQQLDDAKWLPNLLDVDGELDIAIESDATRRRLYEILAEATDVKDSRLRELVLLLDIDQLDTSSAQLLERIRLLPASSAPVIVELHERTQVPICPSLQVEWGRSYFRDANGDALAVEPEVCAESTFRRVSLQLARVDAIRSRRFFPDDLRLSDLLELKTGESDEILDRWNKVGSTLRVPIGVNATETIDFDVVGDGPHLLVGGTTGSGKSEFLQALVLALAINYSPERVNVMLIDYKGGSAFDCLSQLPHCVGMVTDLTHGLAHRMIRSLAAELNFRERTLRSAHAPDIDSFNASDRRELPRLVVVIDEFAYLAVELPEVVSGLTDIARRGRSLGVHVVLATQRPTGVVTREIDANVPARVAFRLVQRDESIAVIGVPDAAMLSMKHPGRGYFLKNQTDIRIFQGACASRKGAAGARPLRVGKWTVTREVDLRGDGEKDGATTELGTLAAAIHEANSRAGFAQPRRPWLPPLPDMLPRSVLAAATSIEPTSIVIGLADVPDEARQELASIPFDDVGSLLIVGSASAGKTTAVRAVADGVLLSDFGQHDVALYVATSSPSGFADYIGHPRCGAVIGPKDASTFRRLLEYAREEVSRRRSAGSVGHPPIFFFVDGVEAFENDWFEVRRELGRLAEDGPGAAVYVVVSASPGSTAMRLSQTFGSILLLRHADPTEIRLYSAASRAFDRSRLGDFERQWPAGRGVLLPHAHEIQVVISSGLEPYRPAGLAHEIGLRRFVALPTRVDAGSFAGERPPILLRSDGAGVGIDDLLRNERLLVVGPPQSGLSTLLDSVVGAARSAGLLVRTLDGAGLGDSLDRLAVEVHDGVRECYLIRWTKAMAEEDRQVLRTWLDQRPGGPVLVVTISSDELENLPFDARWLEQLAATGDVLMLNPRVRGVLALRFAEPRVLNLIPVVPGRGILLQGSMWHEVQVVTSKGG